MIKAVDKYDPFYTQKVKKVADVINEQLKTAAQFTVSEVRRHLDFDCDRHLNLLNRHQFLVEVEKTESGPRYERTVSWPPPRKFFNAGPIGFTYYLSTWFRYSLQQYITRIMSQLETREGVYSLEGYLETNAEFLGDGPGHGHRGNIPHQLDDRQERLRPQHGASGQTLDVSALTLAWVNQTDDPLFSRLSKSDRHLLYLVFAQEQDWDQIASTFSTSARAVKKRYKEILAVVKDIATRPASQTAA